MTKEEARQMLERWIEHKMKYTTKMTLPIVEEVVCSEIETQCKDVIEKESGFYPTGDATLNQWSFKGLIKIAYDLEDKK